MENHEFEDLGDKIQDIIENAVNSKDFKKMTQEQRREALELLELDMRAAAKDLDFEKAADLRDVILELRAEYRL